MCPRYKIQELQFYVQYSTTKASCPSYDSVKTFYLKIGHRLNFEGSKSQPLFALLPLNIVSTPGGGANMCCILAFHKSLYQLLYIVCGIVHNCREPSCMGVGSTIRGNVQQKFHVSLP